MAKYQIRDLLKLTKDELWAIPDGPCQVVYDDGAVKTTSRRTILSIYCQLHNRHHPEAPLVKDQHILNDRFNSSTTLKYIGKSLWGVYDYLAEHGKMPNMDEMTRLCYVATNELYNDFTYRLEEYVTSINALDFIEVIENPEIAKANAEVKPYEASIEHTYSTINDVLKMSKALSLNPIAAAVRSSLVDSNQVMQCVGPRGAVTDIDSTIFKHPILTGYVEGIHKLYDSMIESRSASKALLFTKDPLSDTEYFNRELQLLSGSLKALHGLMTPTVNELSSVKAELSTMRDCGSTKYRDVLITASTLPTMLGKHYLNQKGKLDTVKAKDTHLIGKHVQVRSVFDCMCPDREGFCATCFGEIALSIPHHTNLGHLCATFVCEKVSQAVLSTKHLDKSSNVEGLSLDDFTAKYLKIGSNQNTIGLSDSLKSNKVKLIIGAEDAVNISSISRVGDIANLSAERITQLKQIGIRVFDGKFEEEVPVDVGVGSRFSSLNQRMLQYIKDHGWSLTEKNDYVIDLKDWDHDNMIFDLALKHINMVDYMKGIKRFIMASDKKDTLKAYDCPWQALMELDRIVSSKLKINLAHLEVIVATALRATASAPSDKFPVQGEESEFTSYMEHMSRRSLSALLAYQGQEPVIYNVNSYTVKDRPSHPLDEMIRDPN